MSSQIAPSQLRKIAALLAVGVGVLPVAGPAWSQPTSTARSAPTATSPKASAPAAASTPAVTPSDSIPKNTVVATVNDDKILMSDVSAVLKRIKQAQPEIPVTALDAMRSDIIDDMIIERLLIQEAKRSGLMPDKQKVDDAVWRYQKPFLSQAAYKKHLQDSGKSEEDLRRMLAEELAVNALSKKLTEDVTVSDDEIAKFYNEHKADFVVPEMVRVRHVQISVKSDAPEAERKKAKARAAEVLKQATAPNADFPALAKKHSDDKVSKAAGGDLGYIARDDIVDPAFGSAAFTAPVGKTYNKVVDTKFGYNVLKIEDKKPPRTLALSEVSPYIKPRILQGKLKERLDARVAKLKQSASITKKNL